jgi:hypothetical protein
MQLMNRLCPVLPDVKSAGDWIQNKIEEESPKALISVFESTDKHLRLPTKNKFLRERLLYWFGHLHAMLDGYVWLFAEGYAQPEQVFTNGKLSCIYKELTLIAPSRWRFPVVPLTDSLRRVFRDHPKDVIRV